MTLKGQKALRDVDRASFGARLENLKEDRRIAYYQRQKNVAHEVYFQAV